MTIYRTNVVFKVRSPSVVTVAFLSVLSSIPTIAVSQQSTPATADQTSSPSNSIPRPETILDENPFAGNLKPEIKLAAETDPFDPSLREVAKSRDQPINYASLKSGDLEEAETKLRLLRVSVLQSYLNEIQARINSKIEGQVEFGGPNDLRLYAETMNDLVTIELEISKTSLDRQASIQRAMTAWRDVEKREAAMSQAGQSRDTSTTLLAANQRLRWEQALVKELRSESVKKAVVPPTTQHSSIQYPIRESYPSAQPSPIIIEQPSTYYYPSKPSYSYPRNYRSR